MLFQIFCASPKIYLHIVIMCQTKRWFAFSTIGFCAGTKVFEEALNAFKFLGWLKIFGPAKNILGPVKGQGISHNNSSKLLSVILTDASPICTFMRKSQLSSLIILTREFFNTLLHEKGHFAIFSTTLSIYLRIC